MKTFKDILKVIEETGIIKCEATNCDGCDFDKKSPESKELGNVSICVLLNDIYRTK